MQECALIAIDVGALDGQYGILMVSIFGVGLTIGMFAGDAARAILAALPRTLIPKLTIEFASSGEPAEAE